MKADPRRKQVPTPTPPLFALLAAFLCLVASLARAGDVYQYDAIGRLTRVTHEGGPEITYTYDANGNLLSVNSTPVGVEPAPGSFGFALGRAFPDPASDVARIRFSIPERQRVSLEVFDIRGRRVATLVDGVRDAGQHQAEFVARARARAAGVYVYRLRAGGREQSRRLVVLH